ncbi:4Fe-4S dicluster domain-containing protein [Nitrosophilus kaiyonis]|uniref:4Fe-4S dicluster domain-containing protein n=1 Tax=Nitrosophilus kaiyonis TaxID=2930200 RepID=UPI002490CCFF|nr:4Fe-4S dicluster domain-containing protein [Nitrosophilus kaiyonis]
MKIKLNPSSCVRYYSKFSECKACEEICPKDAIKTEESSLNIYQDECISCGACIGVCPTEALNLSGLNMTNFFFDFLKSEEETISCKTNFVCLAGLNVEYLVSLGLLKEVVLDIGHCENCEIKDSCYNKILQNIEEANYILSTISDKKIKKEKLSLTKEEIENRREFFNIFTLKGVANTIKEVNEDIEALDNPKVKLPTHLIKAIKEKNIPDKRKIFFTVLKKIEKPKEYKYLENEYLTFISQKEIDSSCDNCSICYRICPTGALSSDKKGSKIFFDSLLCVRCHLCHDVCEKNSIKLSQYFDTKEFFEPEEKILAKFNIVKCEDCGMPFSYFGGEKLCQRCKIEEEEAKDLWGIS